MKKLNDLDLIPRGETIIDLLGDATIEMWGTCMTHASYMADWTPEKGALAGRERIEAEKVIKRATRVEMAWFLASRGIYLDVYDMTGNAKHMRFACERLVQEARYPRRFINVAEDVWVCSCGYEGARKPGRFKHDASCAGCGRPSYLLQLKAVREKSEARKNARTA